MAGTISRGIKAPIIKAGDDIVNVVVDSVLKAQEEDEFSLKEKDIIAVTESVVARAANNYCTVDDIADDVREKLGDGTIGVVFPIMSRNRFAICLRGIARAAKKVVILLSYPRDEEGNSLNDEQDLPHYSYLDQVFSEKTFKELFGVHKHKFTGVDYISYYKELMNSEGAEAEVIIGNRPLAIIDKVDSILVCNIHGRDFTKNEISSSTDKTVLTLCDIMNYSRNGSGYNTDYGLLGSNKSTEEKVKLFPNDCFDVAKDIQKEYFNRTGVRVEAMVYGDGAYKDPVGKIWELADPAVSPGFTDGLNRLPNELKLKYLADDEFKNLSGKELEDAIKERIKEKDKELFGRMESQGTTPRFIPNLLGSLCDLTSGSGDKGTPIVVIQNYFDNYTD